MPPSSKCTNHEQLERQKQTAGQHRDPEPDFCQETLARRAGAGQPEHADQQQRVRDEHD